MTKRNKAIGNGQQAGGCNFRHGAALVELAIGFPILLILVLGSIEASSAIYLRQALVTSAYEAAREAARQDGSNATAGDKGATVLNVRNVKSYSVDIFPTDVEFVPRGGEITVTVTAPLSANSPFVGHVLGSFNLTAQSVMVKEALP
jgi:Flp pilus assembly protein TadG